MSQRQRRHLQQQLEAIALTAPQVVLHRTQRSWQAWHDGNPGILGEWWMMGAEKWLAMQEAAWGMAFDSMQLQNNWWMGAWTDPSVSVRPDRVLDEWTSGWIRVANKGIAPVRKRVQRNLRKLRAQSAPARSSRSR
ncbi:MAG: hypothetical protein DI635_00965 [Pseudoxanthomonas suwonensis]|nr:MAG: hypothetical protein DI635_00965 [Pseudoxanthomonas suwonensis]